ncbi:hypothetical protein, partial [Roseobacter sp. HKCCD6925]|uniref:hypothetical protein n=1 Tax=Roseobacter sp. HKCCD6925 TaxID=2690651 RepID=UPI001C0ED0DA
MRGDRAALHSRQRFAFAAIGLRIGSNAIATEKGDLPGFYQGRRHPRGFRIRIDAVRPKPVRRASIHDDAACFANIFTYFRSRIANANVAR